MAALDETSPVDRRGFALEYNPAALAIGRFSGNAEALLAPHSALTFSLAGDARNSAYLRGVYPEVGYRYYSGRGINGFFATASIVGGAFAYHTNGLANPEWVNTYLIGAALDVGYQYQFNFGLQIGAGVGAQLQYSRKRQYEIYQSDFTPLAELLADSGLRPRGLLWVGYAF